MIAALFVESDGVYFGLPDVDPWDEQRDARLYAGPWPVVAHPPCDRWGQLVNVNHARWGTPIGEDGGCFDAALNAVRTWGGVLEHPANSIAFKRFGLPQPTSHGWATRMSDPGVSAKVFQSAYGHVARKETWLYAVGCEDAALDWRKIDTDVVVGAGVHTGHNRGRRATSQEAVVTPLAFRDALLGMARSVQMGAVA